MDFTNKKVLVTGATRGIGFAIAQRFINDGAHVVITGRSMDTLNTAVDKLGGKNVYPLVWDTANIDIRESKLDDVYSLLGGLDVLVNNAGILCKEDYGGMLSVTPESWDMTMDTNLRGVFFLTQAVVRRWIDNKQGGRIVTIDSNNAFRALDHAYACAKWAIRGLITGMGKTFAPYGIYVNGVAPGCCSTTIIGCTDGEIVKDSSPYGRYALPSEIAGMVAFLASEEAGTMVGQILVADGGETLKNASEIC